MVQSQSGTTYKESGQYADLQIFMNLSIPNLPDSSLVTHHYQLNSP